MKEFYHLRGDSTGLYPFDSKSMRFHRALKYPTAESAMHALAALPEEERTPSRLSLSNSTLYRAARSTGVIPTQRKTLPTEAKTRLYEFFSEGFRDRNFQLPCIDSRTSSNGHACFGGVSITGTAYDVRIATRRPGTEFQLRQAYFHDPRGWMLGIFEKDGTRHGDLFGLYNVELENAQALSVVRIRDFFELGTRMDDTRSEHGPCEVVGLSDAWIELKYDSGLKTRVPLDAALEIFANNANTP